MSSTLRISNATVAVFRADMNRRLTTSETQADEGLDKSKNGIGKGTRTSPVPQQCDWRTILCKLLCDAHTA